MAKKITFGVEDAYKKFIEEFEVLSGSEVKIFYNMMGIIHDYPFDYFNVKDKEELTKEFGVVISPEFRRVLHWYRVYLALCDYISWDISCKDEILKDDDKNK